MNVEISAIINLLSQPPSHQRWPVAVETWFRGCEHHELSELVGVLQQQEPPLPTDPEETNWGRLFEHMLQRQRTDLAAESGMEEPSVEKLCALYEFLGPASQVRHLLLALLALPQNSVLHY